MTYTFEPYDVLQIKRNGEWLDFSTLRTEHEGHRAVTLVQSQSWDGQPAEFRIVGPTAQRLVKYELRSEGPFGGIEQ